RILRELTANVSHYSSLLKTYHRITGEFDFAGAKAKLAVDMHGEFPNVVDKAHIHLVDAYHPLLYLFNKRTGKPTIPVSLTLDDSKRFIVISGPISVGKPVTRKINGLQL